MLSIRVYHVIHFPQEGKKTRQILYSSLSNLKHPFFSFFGVIIIFFYRYTCEETGEEMSSHETTTKLVCNIEGGAGSTIQINDISAGLHLVREKKNLTQRSSLSLF